MTSTMIFAVLFLAACICSAAHCRPSSDSAQSAFTAITATGQTGNVGDVVTFEEVPTNVNNHFNEDTSTFVCQIPGTYFFTFTIGVHNGNQATDPIIGLMKNGGVVVSAHARTGTGFYDFDQSSNTAILNLEIGDEVNLQFLHWNNRKLYSDQYKYTTFSGFIFYAFPQ